MDLNEKIEDLGRKYFRFLSGLLKIGLMIYLILSFRKGEIEPAFWFMGISLGLAGILVALPKNKKRFADITKDFIYSTIFFVFAISAGGILILFGEGVSAYYIFISGHFTLESILTGVTFGIYGIVLLGIMMGSSSFIDAVVELFFINAKEDKRPVQGIF